MELLIITAVSEFEKEIKLILKKSGVEAFSYMDVTGYKDLSDQPMETNWFASDIGEHRSVLFYVFVQKELLDKVMDSIDKLNHQQETKSKIHAAVIDVKKTSK
ncbi:MAG: hypothetical protein ABJG78_19645 [Cyclobacteriaceae bacterium]